jgi:hypothetical protein
MALWEWMPAAPDSATPVKNMTTATRNPHSGHRCGSLRARGALCPVSLETGLPSARSPWAASKPGVMSCPGGRGWAR